jgi:putative two-component system response regulator
MQIESYLDELLRFDEGLQRHSLRTGNYAALLAVYTPSLRQRYPQMSAEEICRAMYCAGCLHDVGKVKYSVGLMKKPMRLTSEEAEIMRGHPQRSEEMFRDDPSFLEESDGFRQIVRAGCLYHHERYDGSGYPYGLAAEMIPPEAVIVSICDTLDALTSKRPYKEGWRFEDAAQYIIGQWGASFSPSLLECFLDAKDALEAMYYERFRSGRRTVQGISLVYHLWLPQAKEQLEGVSGYAV